MPAGEKLRGVLLVSWFAAEGCKSSVSPSAESCPTGEALGRLLFGVVGDWSRSGPLGTKDSTFGVDDGCLLGAPLGTKVKGLGGILGAVDGSSLDGPRVGGCPLGAPLGTKVEGLRGILGTADGSSLEGPRGTDNDESLG